MKHIKENEKLVLSKVYMDIRNYLLFGMLLRALGTKPRYKPITPSRSMIPIKRFKDKYQSPETIHLEFCQERVTFT